jgi:hypothetical protein
MGKEMNAEIIVIRYGLPEIENACLNSIIGNTEISYRLTVVDNLFEKKPITRLWNQLILDSQADWIVLLNSDCLVPSLWLSRLLEVAAKDNKIAAVGPSTNSSPARQGNFWPDRRSLESAADIKNIEAVAANLFQAFGSEAEDSEITGFCYMLDRKKFEDAGFFNESFNFYGQETELNLRLRRLGFRVVWAKGVFVYHHGAAYRQIAKAEGRNLDTEHTQAMSIFEKLRSDSSSGPR